MEEEDTDFVENRTPARLHGASPEEDRHLPFFFFSPVGNGGGGTLNCKVILLFNTRTLVRGKVRCKYVVLLIFVIRTELTHEAHL